MESDDSFKAYIATNPEYLQMQNELIKMQIEPIVAAYALFATNFSSTAWAMDFIYEKKVDEASGRPKFQHEFVACLPDRPEYRQISSD